MSLAPGQHEDSRRVAQQPDLLETVQFHGHLCPGLAIGFRAAKIALERLGAKRAEDEELIAIVENDSCSTDAVQWLTGCTFGKGNFFFKDYGKQVFTFAIRPTGDAVRIALKRRDRRSGEPPPQDREAMVHWILTAPAESLFDIRETKMSLPGLAQGHETAVCDQCGEEAMDSRTVKRDHRTLCIPCANE